MTTQICLRFKPEPSKSADLPALDAEQRIALGVLPTDLIRGIARLFRQRPPRITKPNVWQVIVSDALYIATTGWATDALALGWHPLELFGCAAEIAGDDDRLGLAGRLDGRDIVRITSDAALLATAGRPTVLRRNRSFKDTTYLWEYGQ